MRTLNAQVIEEVRAFLRNDDAFLPTPKTANLQPYGHHGILDPNSKTYASIPVPNAPESRYGEIDFTPRGAELYIAIMSEWIGSEWQTGVSVSNYSYWEEHHYCETEAGLREVVQEHIANGSTILAKRVVPIGPWCIHWWSPPFPSGYRLELELGCKN